MPSKDPKVTKSSSAPRGGSRAAAQPASKRLLSGKLPFSNRKAAVLMAGLALVGIIVVIKTFAASNPYSCSTHPTVRSGSTGTCVKRVQWFLNDKMGAGLTINGEAGSATVAAVKKWQYRKGLIADGIVGPITWPTLEAPKAAPGVATGSMKCPVGIDQGAKKTYQGFYVRVCNVQGIHVNASMALETNAMMNRARAAGITMGGWGFRSYERQLELRAINGCPNVYTSPSSDCRIPTAKPGTSMHEQGLAIDFHRSGSTIRSGSAPYNWLTRNAAAHGYINFPLESWHWSVNGR